MNQFAFGGKRLDGTPYTFYETNGGGFGARPIKDGMDGVHAVSNTLNTPIEEIELVYPLVVERYALREGSEGPGEHRGGLGLTRELRFLTDATLTNIGDREKFKPWGVGGGGAAAGCDFYALNGAGERRNLGTKNITGLKAGDLLSINTAGGGGYGAPRCRPRELIERDIADGKVSPERACEIYEYKA